MAKGRILPGALRAPERRDEEYIQFGFLNHFEVFLFKKPQNLIQECYDVNLQCKTYLKLFWYNLGTVLGQCWHTNLGQVWDTVGTVSDQFGYTGWFIRAMKLIRNS